MSSWDVSLFKIINLDASNRLFDVVMPFLSDFNKSVFFWLPIVVFVVWLLWKGCPKKRVYVLLLAITLGLTNEACDVLKFYFQQPRPYEAGVQPLNVLTYNGKPLVSHGFPSAHSANMMALALLTICFFPKQGRWLLLLPLAVGFSRIYVGAHFPSQVFAGWLTGAVISLLVYTVARKRIFRSQLHQPPPADLIEPRKEASMLEPVS